MTPATEDICGSQDV